MTANVRGPIDQPLDGRYRLLADAITDYAIYMLDAACQQLERRANRSKGYTEEEILGEHFSRFYPSEEREIGQPDKALATAAAVGRFETEGWRVRKDGRQFWPLVIIDAIRDPHGQLLGLRALVRNAILRTRGRKQAT
jgi:PAS domain S-box-containing protein